MESELTPAPENTLKTWLQDSRVVLIKHRWTIFSLTAAAVAAVAALSFFTTPVYTAHGTLWIDVESNIRSFQDVFRLEAPNLD